MLIHTVSWYRCVSALAHIIELLRETRTILPDGFDISRAHSVFAALHRLATYRKATTTFIFLGGPPRAIGAP